MTAVASRAGRTGLAVATGSVLLSDAGRAVVGLVSDEYCEITLTVAPDPVTTVDPALRACVAFVCVAFVCLDAPRVGAAVCAATGLAFASVISLGTLGSFAQPVSKKNAKIQNVARRSNISQPFCGWVGSARLWLTVPERLQVRCAVTRGCRWVHTA